MKKTRIAIIILTLLAGVIYSCSKSVESDENVSTELQLKSKADIYYFDNPIAEVVNGNIILSSDLAVNWSENLSSVSDETVVENVYIKKADVGYLLMGSISQGVAGVSLIKIGDIFYESARVSSYGGSTKCTGCESTGEEAAGECEVNNNSDGSFCSHCTAGTCTKTHTGRVGGFLNKPSVILNAIQLL